MNKSMRRLKAKIAAHIGTDNPVSAFKGVTYSATKGMWRASIVRNGRPFVVGYYDTELRAAEAVKGVA